MQIIRNGKGDRILSAPGRILKVFVCGERGREVHFQLAVKALLPAIEECFMGTRGRVFSVAASEFWNSLE